MTSTQPTARSEALTAELRAAIRDVPDFPRPGIMFKDITPLLASPSLFRAAVDAMAAPYATAGITHVAAIESRGFLLGGPIAHRLGAGVIPIRKPGKLPAARASVTYALEYGTDCLEIHEDACGPDARVLLVDDVLATGGTAAAAVELLNGRGATIVGCSFLIALAFLGGEARLGSTELVAVLRY